MPKAHIFIKSKKWPDSDNVQQQEVVRDDKVDIWIREQLRDGSGNRAIIIENNNGYQEIWTREWKEVTL